MLTESSNSFPSAGENNHINDIVTDGEGAIGKALTEMIHESETCGLGGDEGVLGIRLTARLTLPPCHSLVSVMIGSVS